MSCQAYESSALGSGHHRALPRPEALCFGLGTGRSVIGWSAWRREGALGLVAAAFGVGLSGLCGDANTSTRAPGREPSPGQRWDQPRSRCRPSMGRRFCFVAVISDLVRAERSGGTPALPVGKQSHSDKASSSESMFAQRDKNASRPTDRLISRLRHFFSHVILSCGKVTCIALAPSMRSTHSYPNAGRFNPPSRFSPAPSKTGTIARCNW